jgi:histidyl-tRNA synthetase
METPQTIASQSREASDASTEVTRQLETAEQAKKDEKLNKMEKNRRTTVALPKGVRDFSPNDMKIRAKAFSIVESVFQQHGAVQIDTPVFELKETLLGQYGEDNKLVYDLCDQGGQMLSLRYDLTVPFARYLAMNNIKKMRRYHIGKVYRRDDPAMARGRFREFYQCDFDIAGDYTTRLPDAECLAMIGEILTRLDVGAFTIKVSHRQLLDGLLKLCGVPEDKVRTICSAIDKLDKTPWDKVRAEMLEKKLDPAAADRIGKYVQLSGEPKKLLAELQSHPEFAASPQIQMGLSELNQIFGYLELMGSLNHVTLDLSLARGLDYYTGAVFEAITLDKSIGVGSIAGGGRYDNLVGTFTEGNQIPAVGFCIGIERVMAILTQKRSAQPEPEVLVTTIYQTADQIPECLELTRRLRQASITADYAYSPFAKTKQLAKQLREADERHVPYVVILGLEPGAWLVKNMVTTKQERFTSQDEVLVYLQMMCQKP